ncbi:17653_t:CDS:1, partial [Racocetra fulgida]
MFDKEVFVGRALQNGDNKFIISLGDKFLLKTLPFYDKYYYRRSEKELRLADEITYNELVERIIEDGKNSKVRFSE